MSRSGERGDRPVGFGAWWPTVIILMMVVLVPLAPERVAAAEPSVEMTLWPHVCNEPCSLRVTVRTTPDDDNRGLYVELDSSDFFRSSALELDGSNAAAVHSMEFNGVPAGTYRVRAVIADRQGVAASTLSHLVVHGPGSP